MFIFYFIKFVLLNNIFYLSIAFMRIISKTLQSMVFCGSLLISNWSAAQSLSPELGRKIINANQGSIVELPGFLTEQFPKIEYQKIIQPGPQFIISDDPEYIRVPEAIALREAVQPGTVRLYVYNVNGVKDIETKIVAVIKNTGTAPMRLRMLKYSSQVPSTNYFKIGKQGLADFFNSKPQTTTRIIKPGEVVAIDRAQDKYRAKYDELVHGFYEFVIDQPGQISILQTSPTTSVATAYNRIKIILPSKTKTGAGRGMFGVSNYQVNTQKTIDTKDGASQIIIADGEHDPWVIGKESTTEGVATLDGNYGVIYSIDVKWKSSDGKGLALVTWNPRSDNGQWCGGMANTMVVSEGKFNPGVIQLPSDKLITTKSPEAILVQVFQPSGSGEEQTIRLKYSPPGASCLPTPLVFIPVDIK
jgi:hypothetical protein